MDRWGTTAATSLSARLSAAVTVAVQARHMLMPRLLAAGLAAFGGPSAAIGHQVATRAVSIDEEPKLKHATSRATS